MSQSDFLCFSFLSPNKTLTSQTSTKQKWKIKMEDDVEVELELEKQLSLAHEMFWQLKVEIFSQQRELLLNNNFSRQRKLSNFEEDEFPKKQSNLCFSSTKMLPCGEISSLNECQDKFFLPSKEMEFKEIFSSKYDNIPSGIKMSLLKINNIIQKWIAFEYYFPYK